MIIRKSPAELDKMRRAGAILASTIDRVLAAVAPGRDDARARPGRRSVDRRGGRDAVLPRLRGGGGRIPFPATICASINDEIVHGIPSLDARARATATCLAGLRRDLGGVPFGFRGDGVRRASPPSDDAKRLVEATEAALDAAIAVIRPGGRLSDIGYAIEQVASQAGVGVVREYGGHGIGRAMHEDPFIQNWGKPGRGPELKPGLVVAVEPMFNLGGDETAVLADGWTVVTADGSLSAHFEHTIAVTQDGHEVLTARD